MTDEQLLHDTTTMRHRLEVRARHLARAAMVTADVRQARKLHRVGQAAMDRVYSAGEAVARGDVAAAYRLLRGALDKGDKQ